MSWEEVYNCIINDFNKMLIEKDNEYIANLINESLIVSKDKHGYLK